MSPSILYVVLGFLLFSVGLNLKLTIGLIKSVNALSDAAMQSAVLPAGSQIPELLGRPLGSRESMPVVADGEPNVLLFLSSTCPKCRSKLPELQRLMPLADHAGVRMRLVSPEAPWRLKRFLLGSSLSPLVMRVGKQDFAVLNPTLSSPHYMFVDHEGRLEASGPIGDDDWLSFCDQLAQWQVAEAEAA